MQPAWGLTNMRAFSPTVLRGMGSVIALLGIAAITGGLPGAGGGLATWEQWRHILGIFDVVGPRSDGSLVVAAGQRLALVTPSGTVAPFGDGANGYQATPGESYIALSPGLHVAAAGCNFVRDDLFALRLSKPFGVTRIDGAGQAHDFATLPGVDSLNGIAFDVTGR
ncbi:MAG TPA: hypothetical protein VET65_06545, partial [Candidatus Limnocylindrales bacterium]|nr:hypothetical protein [Candidatus Limnocylindrales bacterium]